MRGLRLTITQFHTHRCTMQQTHMHKAVTGHVVAKTYSLVEGNQTIKTVGPSISNYVLKITIFGEYVKFESSS